MPAKTTSLPDITAELAYLTRALKAPTMREAIDRLGTRARNEGWSRPQLHASWLHLHWGGCPFIPERLAQAARLTTPLSSS